MDGVPYDPALDSYYAIPARRQGKSWYMQQYQADFIGDDKIRGREVDYVAWDEWSDIESGAAQAHHNQIQSELEAVPGFGTF